MVSIITATFNSEHHLPHAINSIRKQIYENIEWIIVDGASSDSTLTLIKQNEDVIDYWISEPDSGIYDAWNKGVSLANGEWIAFLGCDDAYYPEAIEHYINYLHANIDMNFDYVSSRVNLVNARREHIQTIGRKWTWQTFRKKMVVAHVGSLHRRSLYDRFGLYDTTYKTAADYEFLLRPRESLRAGFFDLTTASMQFGGASSDMFPALAEAKRAKQATGGRASTLCDLDNVIDMTKIVLKRNFNKKYQCK